jgi:hypothetical protein
MSVESSANMGAPLAGIADGGLRRWPRPLLIALVLAVIAAFPLIYYKRVSQGLVSSDSMDIAQIGRNLVEGRGYVTRFVRPFNVAKLPPYVGDLPEVNHAPLAPLADAVMFKLRSCTDQSAATASLAFCVLTVFAAFLLGLVLFDWRVGLLSAAAVGTGIGPLDAGISGEAWAMAGFWFALLLIAVDRHHASTLAGKPGVPWTVATACVAALLYLTHHILFVLSIPLAVYFGITGLRRKLNLAVFLVVFGVLIAPWAYRNLYLTGFPVIGINAWDLMANSDAFPGITLYRTTDAILQNPVRVLLFPLEHFTAFARKLSWGLSDVLIYLGPVLGLAVLAFFTVGMLYRFRKQSANAVRGLMYGITPLVVLSFGLFSVDPKAVVMFTPAVAAFGSAYFLLLLDAKKLHQFYYRVLVALFVLAMSYGALTSIVWPPRSGMASTAVAVHNYFQSLGSRGVVAKLFTDVPWAAAWRTMGLGIWLPVTDDDVGVLSSKGLPMEAIVLTPESDKYSPDEIWFNLHNVELWREYIRDPRGAAEKAGRTPAWSRYSLEQVEQYLKRAKRQFAISKSLDGFVVQSGDPLVPDDLFVLLVGDVERH